MQEKRPETGAFLTGSAKMDRVVEFSDRFASAPTAPPGRVLFGRCTTMPRATLASAAAVRKGGPIRARAYAHRRVQAASLELAVSQWHRARKWFADRGLPTTSARFGSSVGSVTVGYSRNMLRSARKIEFGTGLWMR